ncbi:MAG: Ig-like domain-containing protein [Clostridium sp.]|nr:Ig-like domain-containing protein [Bacteroides sp.]MCM1199186.1 Ig-like domain-containing protein [Clostridium sp.]
MKVSRSLLIGGGILSSILLLASCEQPAGNPGEDEKVTVEFSQDEVSVPIHGNGSVSINVTPPSLAPEVEISVADKDIVTVEDTEIDGGTIKLTLKSSSSLGSTTVIALLEDQMDKCTVNISPIAVESIALNKTVLDLAVGEQDILSASYLPENATSPSMVWKSDNEDAVIVSNGVVTAVGAGTAKVSARCGECEATCEVNVHVVEAESLTFDIVSRELTEEEAFIINATILPENITYKDVKWEVSNPEVLSLKEFDAKDDNIVSATVTALKEGNATVTATVGGKKAVCSVSVKAKVVPVADPKIGDYFYSDGTWSDGGLVSINSDGTKPVWAASKPAPVEGKTVIGIIFQTDSKRFSQEEQNAGHVHGLVLAAKSAHAPGKTLTMYSLDDAIDCIGTHRLASSCYQDIFGQRWTATVLNAYQGRIDQCPAFDWTTTDFSPAAPANTSGWFVPSIGQVWDMVVNLGGEEIAEYMKLFRDYDYQFDGAVLKKMSYDPLAKINSHFSMIPEADREDLVTSRPYSDYEVCELISSTLYAHDGTCCTFWLCTNGNLEMWPGWVNDNMVCRPVLAF